MRQNYPACRCKTEILAGITSIRCLLLAQIRQVLGLVVVLLFVAGLLLLVGLVEWLEHYLETDLGYT